MDKGQRETERNLRKIVKALRGLYGNAAKEFLTILQAYTKSFEKESEKKREKLKNGEISEDNYTFWLKCSVFRGEKWSKKAKSLVLAAAEVNKKALKIIRGGQIETFTDNGFFYSDELRKAFSMSIRFDIFDRMTVERILMENPQLLPEKVLNLPKDMIWNRRIINNSVVQGIIQGDSVPRIAERIANDLANLNKNQSIRYARTAVTSAQNAGRLEQMRAAGKMGIRVQKKWLSAHDSRTRDAHLHLDGQIREIDEPFDSDLGEIMFPADPAADPANVWNCRCCLVYHYPDYQTG